MTFSTILQISFLVITGLAISPKVFAQDTTTEPSEDDPDSPLRPKVHNTTIGLELGGAPVHMPGYGTTSGYQTTYLPGTLVFIENDPAHPGFNFWRRFSLGSSKDGPVFYGALGAEYAGPWWTVPLLSDGAPFKTVRIFGGLGLGARVGEIQGVNIPDTGPLALPWLSLEGSLRAEAVITPQLSVATGAHFSFALASLGEPLEGLPAIPGFWFSAEPIALTYRPRVGHPHYGVGFIRRLAFGVDLGFGDYSAPVSLFIENTPTGPKVYCWGRLAWIADLTVPSGQGTLGVGVASPPILPDGILPGSLGELRLIGGVGTGLARAQYSYYKTDIDPHYGGMVSLEYFTRVEVDLGEHLTLGTGVRVSQPLAILGVDQLGEKPYEPQVIFEALTVSTRIGKAGR